MGRLGGKGIGKWWDYFVSKIKEIIKKIPILKKRATSATNNKTNNKASKQTKTTNTTFLWVDLDIPFKAALWDTTLFAFIVEHGPLSIVPRAISVTVLGLLAESLQSQPIGSPPDKGSHQSHTWDLSPSLQHPPDSWIFLSIVAHSFHSCRGVLIHWGWDLQVVQLLWGHPPPWVTSHLCISKKPNMLLLHSGLGWAPYCGALSVVDRCLLLSPWGNLTE